MKYSLLSLFATINICVYGQTTEERGKIVSNYDLNYLDSLRVASETKFRLNKAKAIDFARENHIPERFVDEKGNYNELMYIENSFPFYYTTHNAGSAITARVNRINSGGSAGLNLNGQGMILGIWDGGPVRGSHQDLQGRVTFKDGENFSSTSEGSSHGTHVAGTMIGSGFGSSTAKGLAYQASLWGNTFSNDEAEVISQASQGLLVSNHSYGLRIDVVPEYFRGAYTAESASWDNIMFNAPYYQAVISAGNDRGSAEDNKGGRDLLIGNKNSKNAIVVAAVNNVSNYVSPASVVMSSFSSWGPTDDFRIKPDISAKGVAVFSLNSTSDTAYQSLQGTSMASPAVAATLVLFQQHYNNLYSNYMKASTLKAVMTNSADEAGDYDGPDYQFGWGLINAKKGTDIITQKGVGSIIDERILVQGGTYTRNVVASGTQPLKVTVAWTDRSGQVNTGTLDDASVKLVNDLDVRVLKGGETYYPWVLNPFFLQGGAVQDDNPYDNIESVDVVDPQGTYTIVISHKGNLVGGEQNYSLVVSGVTESLGVKDDFLENFVLYPNPSENYFEVSFSDESGDEVFFQLYDALGRVVSESKHQYSGRFEQVFDVSQLSSGVYYAKFSIGNKVKTTKVNVR